MDYFIIAITTIAGLAFHGWLIMRFRQAQLDATTPRRREESEDQAAGTTKLAGAADTTLPRPLIRTLSEDQTRTNKPRFHGL